MSDPFVGEVRVFANNFIPAGWLPCDGSTLQINGFQALFATIGNIYGGNASQGTFALPNLNGQAVVGSGTVPGGSIAYQMGTAYGEAGVTVNTAMMAAHTHQLQKKNTNAAAAVAKTAAPSGSSDLGGLSNTATPAVAFQSGVTTSASINTYLSPAMIGVAGAAAPAAHENRQPFLALYFAIAWQGDFAPRP